MERFIKSFSPILAMLLIIAAMMCSVNADTKEPAETMATEVDIIHCDDFTPTATNLEKFKVVANGAYGIEATNGELEEVDDNIYILKKTGDMSKRTVATISWAGRKAQVRERPAL